MRGSLPTGVVSQASARREVSDRKQQPTQSKKMQPTLRSDRLVVTRTNILHKKLGNTKEHRKRIQVSLPLPVIAWPRPGGPPPLSSGTSTCLSGGCGVGAWSEKAVCVCWCCAASSTLATRKLLVFRIRLYSWANQHREALVSK